MSRSLSGNSLRLFVVLFYILKLLKVFVGFSERLSRYLLNPKVEVCQCFFRLVLFVWVFKDDCQLFSHLCAVGVHFIQFSNVLTEFLLDFRKIDFLNSINRYLFGNHFFMRFDVFLVADVTFLFKNLIMSQKGLNNRTEFSQRLFEVLQNRPILFDFTVILPVVGSLCLLVRVVSLGVHSAHRLRHSSTTDWHYSSLPFVIWFRSWIELLSELLLAFEYGFVQGLLFFHFLVLLNWLFVNSKAFKFR